MRALAIDVGGTKIAAAVVDETGTVIRSVSHPTPKTTADDVFDALRRGAVEVLADERVDGVGIACAGPVDTIEGTVSPVNIPTWRGFPLRERVAELVPNVRTELAGDGVCMALGEHWIGAGVGSDAMIGLVVSTGVGGGLVLGGRQFPGRTGNAGHIGHIVAEPTDGQPCPCGGRGCVETVASGPNLVRWARRQGWQAPDHADAAHLAAAAQTGDRIALAAFTRSGRAVGVAIAATATLCDLRLAVVGGGVAQAGALLFDPMRAAIAEHATLSYVAPVTVVPAALGKHAGLVGAAGLVIRST